MFKSFTIFLFLTAVVVFFSAALPALAQDTVPVPCTVMVNGQDVPCEQLGRQVTGLLGLGLGFAVVMGILSLLATVFWVVMLIHAATKPIQNKVVWILILLFTGIFGALIYYFAVKRSFDRQVVSPSPAITQELR